ncbi:MAG: DNA-3-methyladenine glycosylase [Leptolyngbya sp. SIO3F4]|nr:DNA-3-methyladenine glycosylase [Leptolyngbya sp. SIO3F4]
MTDVIISADWCDRNTLYVAPDLIGCTLVRQFNGETLRGLIVETEAYCPNDPACHAYRSKTPSNAAMFGPPGHSYIYFIYGMYHCFNVVTEATGTGSAVLIRAVELSQLPKKLDAKYAKQGKRAAAGPGKLCRTLAINRSHNALPLVPQYQLWLEHRTNEFQRQIAKGQHILSQTTRIGISKAADQPWRWYLKGNPSVSKT